MTELSLQLTINAADPADLRRQLADLLGTTADVTAPAPAANKRPTRTETAPRAEPEPATSETATTASDAGAQTEAASGQSAQAESVADAGAQGGSALTYDGDIKPAVLKVSAKHGRPGVEKLLAGFSVANAKEVPEAKWPEFLAEIDKLLA